MFLIVFCYFCIHLKLPLLQDVVDGDDDRAAAEEASDANSADVGKMKFTMLRLTDMTPCRNYFYFGSLLSHFFVCLIAFYVLEFYVSESHLPPAKHSSAAQQKL